MKAVFPGIFDPVTNGHVDVARRAATLFHDLVIAVYDDPPAKRLMFTTEERVQMFQHALGAVPGVEVRPYSGLTVGFAREIGAHVIIRGLRIGADFEYEREMALMNRRMAPGVEVVCLIASLENQYVSSSRVKEVATLGADVSAFVPEHVKSALYKRLGDMASSE